MMLLRCIIPFVVVSVSLTLPSVAQEKTFGRRVAELVAPLDAESAVVVIHVDLAKLDVQAIAEWAIQAAPASDRENAEFTAGKIRDLTSKIKAAGALESTTVFYPSRVNNPFSAPGEIAVILATKPGTAKTVADAIRPVLTEQYFDVQERGDTVLLALPSRLNALTPHAAPSETIATAFDAAKPAPLRLIVQVPKEMRRVIRETLPKLPDELGGLSGPDIADGVLWGTMSFNVPPGLQINAEIRTANEDISRSLAKLIDSGVKQLEKIPQSSDPDRVLARISPTIEVEPNKVRLSIGGKPGDSEVVQAALNRYLTATRQIKIQMDHLRKLQQFGLALHNFLDEKKSFPAQALRDASGKPLLSWRVQLLPYIGHGKLYAQFKLDESWDSEHNKKLIDQMPKEFASPLVAIREKGKTPFVAPIAKGSIFSGKEGVKLFDITDGTSNTILLAVADAEHAVIWTKPDDLTVDVANPLFGMFYNDYDGRKQVHFLFGDGSVRGGASADLVDKLLPSLTMNGGEVVSF